MVGGLGGSCSCEGALPSSLRHSALASSSPSSAHWVSSGGREGMAVEVSWGLGLPLSADSSLDLDVDPSLHKQEGKGGLAGPPKPTLVSRGGPPSRQCTEL